MTRPYPTDREAKATIIACGKRLYQRGLITAADGNLSALVSPDTLWATPTGVSKGLLTEDMLVKVHLSGHVLEGACSPSSELPMHLRIYRESPEIKAVVHAHPPAATAFAAAGMPLDRPILQEAVVQLGTVPLAPYALPGSPAVGDSVAPFCQDFKGALLEYHGAVTWGNDLEQALCHMETLEHYALILLHLKTLGCERVMPPSLVAQLHTLGRSKEQ